MDDETRGAVVRLARLFGERLEAWLAGDEQAFATLAEAIDVCGFAGHEIEATALLLQGLAIGAAAQPVAPAANPGPDAHRVPSAAERAALTPEAWGCLLDLRRRGTLDAEQFEQVLERLAEEEEGPAGVERARTVAARVVLQLDGLGEETAHGGLDIAH